MTRRQVWQYKCDFCGKKQYRQHSMKAHEEGCTMNPNRVCRMHSYGNLSSQLPMTEIMKVLKTCPQPPKNALGIVPGFVNISALRDSVDNCPMCILAALRQSGMAGFVGPEIFDFKKEKDAFWEECRDDMRWQ